MGFSNARIFVSETCRRYQEERSSFKRVKILFSLIVTIPSMLQFLILEDVPETEDSQDSSL
jgi:hypothetical protein